MKKRKSICLVLCGVLLAGLLAGCTNPAKEGESVSGKKDKLQVVATIFPPYDFVRQIGGEKVNVVKLLPPGTESHTFDPTPRDMMTVQESDLFVYTGDNMEPWAAAVVKSIDSARVAVVDCSQGISLFKESHEEGEAGHDHEYDPHIWLDPTLAEKMVDHIAAALCAKDPDNASFYQKNADHYKTQLADLDQRIQQTVNTGKRNTVAFGGKFAYLYFLKRYQLDYRTAFDSCSSQGEPSVKQVGAVIEYVKKNQIPVVFYEELSTPKVARSIADSTGAELLQFSTAHNVSKEEFEKGITYLDIMNQNLDHLKQALN